MIRLRVVAEAEAEMSAAALWYESKRSGLGAEYLASIDEAFERIGDGPLAFPVWKPDKPYRRCVVERFPFVIFFTVSPSVILVLAVAHAKRRPGYWLGR